MPNSNRANRARAVIDFSTLALRNKGDIDGLLAEASRCVADGLGVSRAKVLEYLPQDNRFLVRAGVNWNQDVVGHATIGADLDSPAGYAFKTREPVTTADLASETRFRWPVLLQQHGVKSAANVIIQTADFRYGVLEVDHTDARDFHDDDVEFLQGFANILANAIDRQRNDAIVQNLLAEKDVLLRDVTHRVKNNLALVASLLSLQQRRSNNPAIKSEFTDAISRIKKLELIHDRLYGLTAAAMVPVPILLRDLRQTLLGLAPDSVSLKFEAESGTIHGSSVVPLCLIINELVTNALKHAFPDRNGEIVVRFDPQPDGMQLTVRDNGVGLPSSFDFSKAQSVGMLIVQALASQIEAKVDFSSSPQGTCVTLIKRRRTAPASTLTPPE